MFYSQVTKISVWMPGYKEMATKFTKSSLLVGEVMSEFNYLIIWINLLKSVTSLETEYLNMEQ